MTESNEEFTSLSEAAEYARTCRQAIYLAIHKGSLKAEKRLVKNKRSRWLTQWVVKKTDLDEYRKTKYSRDKRTFNGQKLFDLDESRVSVLQASKILSQALDRPYPTARIYYLLRTGKARGLKKAAAWIIEKDVLLAIYALEGGNTEQMELVQ